jgi:hypothetical protein
VKKGEPFFATTNATGTNLAIKWSINPSLPSTWTSAEGNKSSFLVATPGSYTITASYFADSTNVGAQAFDSSSNTVIVSDSVYSDSSVAICDALIEVPILLNDQLTITPVSYSDTGLALFVHTQDTYANHYPTLNYGIGSDSTVGYEFEFGTITEYPCGSPTVSPTPASALLSLGAMTPGTFPFSVVLSGTVYTGSVVVTPSSCTFNWNYSSGVIISPLTIQLQ